MTGCFIAINLHILALIPTSIFSLNTKLRLLKFTRGSFYQDKYSGYKEWLVLD